MLNHRVRTAAEGMPKFDRAAIMAHAWRLYRKQWTGARPVNLQARRKSFSRCLKSAWMTAKWNAAEALKTADQRAADRVQELTLELMRDDARDWRVPGRVDRRAIFAEIAVLERRV